MAISIYKRIFLGIFFIFATGITSLTDGQDSMPLIPLSVYSFLTVFRSKIFVPAGRSPVIGDCYIRHYIRNTTDQSKVYRFARAKELLQSPYFELNNPTVLYIHGYVESYTDTSIRTVISAYLRRGGYNVLLLDWSNLAYGQYLSAATNVFPVGRALGTALLRLLSSGLRVTSLHVVGHSLGAHIAGVAGRYLKSRNYTLPRITGLDPALPGFYLFALGPSLTKDAAQFVDVIHTDSGQYGTSQKTGHADFWPNGGRAKQPGCIPFTIYFTVEDFCSHWRSWGFWAESVLGGRFLARRCDSYDTFLRGDCRLNETTNMGLLAHSSAEGNYYLLTATRAPFALGDRGAG